MIEIKTFAAQGDVAFRRVAQLPANAVEQKHDGRVVVAHSETGHDHVIESRALRHFDVPGNSLVSYLVFTDDLTGGGVDVVHHRPWDTHAPMRLLGSPGDVWEVRRQREWTPEGWRRVED